ncbi:RagB/SusD family nutrient uptake outer membrane protein [Chitinophagaceae bacterium 26-R-25]|nr:RagB/SusD family nutrient uptake outer membrane protein [Chitinophagaceae bacterium 26-R-25]
MPKQIMSVYMSVVFLLVATLCGCNKFLDVRPKDKVPQPELFKDAQGFKDALNGVYLCMDKPSGSAALFGLYTGDLSMSMLSTLAYDYDNAATANVGSNSSFFLTLASYNYADATIKAEQMYIWNGMYFNIANLNNLLSQIDDKKGVFKGDDYNRIKGEATALRALLHFDLARMFGQPPLTGMNAPAIPYVTRYGVTSTPFSSLSNVLDSCIRDLSAAKDILAQTDTSAVLKAVDDPFTSYTQNHMNYWAVEALTARVYLYKGDMVNADKYAKAVIASGKFPLITSNVALQTNAVRDRLFSQELVFSVYSSNLKTYNLNLFNKSSGTPLQVLATKGATPTAADSVGNKYLYYRKGSGAAGDYRFISWFDKSTAGVQVPSKYFQDDNLPYYLQGNVPVIRVSEMYYIAAEAANANGDIATGVAFLNNVRQARGLPALSASGINYADSLSSEIMAEYRKEFVQEGQTFFYYKRLNKDLKQVTTTAAPVTAGVYTFPIPDAENEYNH